MNTSTFLPGTVFVQVFIYLFDLCCTCEKECREWNWQSRHCYYPQPYRGNTELAPEESAVWLGSDAGAATELLHCIASLTLVVYLAPSTIDDSFSNKPHKSNYIYGWLNRRYAWEGETEKSCSRSVLLNTPALEKIQSRVLCFGSRWSALWVDLWVEETWCEVVCELLYIRAFSMASALCVGPWTFLVLFNSCNVLHLRSTMTHWHPAAVLGSLCCSRTLEQGLTRSDLPITSFTTSATAAHHSWVDKNRTRQS